MSLIAACVRELMAAGLSGEPLLAAIARIEAEMPAAGGDVELTPRQARNRRYYEKIRLNSSENKMDKTIKTLSDGDVTPPLDKENPPHPLKKLNPSPPSLRSEKSSAREANDWPSDFRQRFWDAYPRKVAKQNALKALDVVRKGGKVTFAALLAALKRYAVANPDPQFVKHPERWLRGGCWDDDPTALARAGPQQLARPLTPREVQKQKSDDAIAKLKRFNQARTGDDRNGASIGVLGEDRRVGPGDISGGRDGTAGDLFEGDDRARDVGHPRPSG